MNIQDGQKTVLIIDSSKLELMCNSTSIKLCGYNVISILWSTGKFNKIAENINQADVVVLDWWMNEYSPEKIVQKIQKLTPGRNIPIIILSTINTPDLGWSIGCIEDIGIIAELSKPLNKELIKQVLNNYFYDEDRNF